MLLKEQPLERYKASDLASAISMVLTEPVAAKNMTVVELVALGRHPYTNWMGTLTAVDRTAISNALSVLELEELKQKKCYELSDGQLQRVLIARALAQDTMVMLLDEPTTHLDLYHKVKILKLLKSIAHKANKAVLFTSHEIEMTLQLCDKLLVLNGQDSAFGTPQELIAQGQFEKLFPADTVSFDPTSRGFRIEK